MLFLFIYSVSSNQYNSVIFVTASCFMLPNLSLLLLAVGQSRLQLRWRSRQSWRREWTRLLRTSLHGQLVAIYTTIYHLPCLQSFSIVIPTRSNSVQQHFTVTLELHNCCHVATFSDVFPGIFFLAIIVRVHNTNAYPKA